MQIESSDVIWRNARLATMDPAHMHAYGLLERHDLVIRGDKILAVVPEGTLPNHQCRVIDAENRLITPGLIDCHTHLVFGGNRAYEWEQRLNGVSYAQISAQGGGINSTVAATRASSIDSLLHHAQQRLNALMAEGVTTIEMKSGYGLDLESEEKILQVIKQLSTDNLIDVSATLLAAHTTPKEYKENPDGYIDLICREIMPILWQKGLFEAVDVFCENVGFTLAQTERVFQAAQSLGIPIKGHVEQLSNMGGSALIARYHGLSADHIEFLDQPGIEALSKQDTVAVLLPGAFYFLRETQRPPVDLLRQFNVPMAVSTDFNPGTSPFASLRMAMNMACVQFGLTPEEAWLGVTRHAAQALGRQQSHGQLSAGFKANFIVWDAVHPVDVFYELGHNPLVHRVFNGKITDSSSNTRG
ncbi:Imidazolonepropionase [Pragia fontium]|uniref:Imidazolonepropionase n=1 Tax=Pragia fontium TaxID=82985 RepID=A0ABQ5LJ04_9GAMM|nr:imidazolonepropionase [Pragia fontium]GKX63598.1 imidazolonepropionase [Pragia fontium]SUB83462.1 Imidazolonepropionase [Pragia fontium]